MIFPEGAGCEREGLRKYIPNYRINLVDAERLQDINVFQTDLQYVLNMIKYRQKKEKILEYVEANRSYFQRMNMDTYQALSVFLNSEKWLEEISVPEGKGEMDMCKALEDIYEDGKIEKLREQVSKKLQKGKSLETIAEELEESAETIVQRQSVSWQKNYQQWKLRQRKIIYECTGRTYGCQIISKLDF